MHQKHIVAWIFAGGLASLFLFEKYSTMFEAYVKPIILNFPYFTYFDLGLVIISVIAFVVWWKYRGSETKSSKKKIKHDADLELVFRKFTTLYPQREKNHTFIFQVLQNPLSLEEQIGQLDHVSDFIDKEYYKMVWQRVPDQVENYDMFYSHLKHKDYLKTRGDWNFLFQTELQLFNTVRLECINLIKKQLKMNMSDNNPKQIENQYDIESLSEDFLYNILKRWEKRNDLDFKNLKKKEHDADQEALGIDLDEYYDGIVIDCKTGEDVDLEKMRNIMILISKNSDFLDMCSEVRNLEIELHKKTLEFRKKIQKILDDKDEIKGECKICNPKFSSNTH